MGRSFQAMGRSFQAMGRSFHEHWRSLFYSRPSVIGFQSPIKTNLHNAIFFNDSLAFFSLKGPLFANF